MSAQNGDALNIDQQQADIQEKMEKVKTAIISKLTDGYGYELQDDTLSDWIIAIAIQENKPKSEVQQDLVEFIADHSEEFTIWLWKEAKNICSPPKPVAEKPKKAPVVRTRVMPNKASKGLQKGNENLLKHALGDVKKGAKNDQQSAKSSFISTNKDGSKVINLNSKDSKTENRRRDHKYASKREERDEKVS